LRGGREKGIIRGSSRCIRFLAKELITLAYYAGINHKVPKPENTIRRKEKWEKITKEYKIILKMTTESIPPLFKFLTVTTLPEKNWKRRGR